MRTILPVLVGVSLALSAAVASAQIPAQKEVKLSIERQTLRDALNEWAQQTGFQLVSEINTEFVAPRVKGTLTPQAALERLLVGTPLTYEWLNDRVVAVHDKTQSVSPVGRQSTGDDAKQPAPHITKFGDDGLAGPQLAANDQVAAPRTARASRDTESGITDVEEIVVAGSRLRHGKDEGPAPVIIIDRDRIDQLGVTNVADVLNYLPQQSFALDEANAVSGSRRVQLRGLGVGTTLVLINGRRTVTSALTGSRNYFDLNTIPLPVVDRVEVLSDSASAIYGADAVGGVVNVVLKRATDRPVLTLDYGSADGGADEARAAFAFGHRGERLQASIAFDYYARDVLLGEERDRFANQDFRRFGGVDRRATTSNPGNISSRTSANLPGLPSTFAAVPAGSSGTGLTTASFLPTAGIRNLESTARFSSIVPESERYGGTAMVDAELTGALDVFGEFMWVSRTDESLLPPASISNRVVPASNAFNPFGTSVAANYLFAGIGPRVNHAEAESYRAVTGLTGNYSSWDWELSVLGIKERGRSELRNNVDTARVNAALASSDATQALNVFQDGPGGSPELLTSLLAEPVPTYVSSDALQAGTFVRASELFQLPAGYMAGVVGLEARKERLANDNRSTGVRIEPDRKSTSAYMEFRMPLVTEDFGVPLVQGLILSAAGRYDDYDDFGSTFNPQYGLEWRVFRSLLLRASFGTSFRAPSLFELYQTPTVIPASTVQDPRRGNESASITLLTGGNPDLDPEESDSLTAGFVLTLGASNRLRIGASYWRIAQEQRVQRLSTNQLLASEASFPDRVVRATPTAQDLAAGRPGRLVSVTATSLNYGPLETSGIDVDFSNSFDTDVGQFSQSVMATWVNEYDSADFPASPMVNRVGIANTLGTVPRWRAAGTLSWLWNGFQLSTTVRYVAGYDDTTSNVVNGSKVDSLTLVDIQGGIDLSDVVKKTSSKKTPSFLNGVSLRLGVKNILDEEPPYSDVLQSGYDATLGDVRQRFAYVSLSKSF